MKLESLLQYLDGYLDITGIPDYGPAHNGLQVQGPAEVTRLGFAVDSSERSIAKAVEAGCDLLVVHHGLFWDGEVRVIGRRARKLSALLRGGLGVFSVHLPLDGHAEVGNCAVLTRALGWEPAGRFGSYQGFEMGWWAETDEAPEALQQRLAGVVGGEVRMIPGGQERIYRVGVVTGAASSLIEDAAEAGLDALITGEGPHHSYYDAVEFGVTTYYAGHYATETWGLKALAAHLEERFELPWVFLEDPSGL
jgi:dinuclear metal center YbgI/SA1388 family protein